MPNAGAQGGREIDEPRSTTRRFGNGRQSAGAVSDSLWSDRLCLPRGKRLIKTRDPACAAVRGRWVWVLVCGLAANCRAARTMGSLLLNPLTPGQPLERDLP